MYYLKKLEREYKKLLTDTKILNDTNIYYSEGSFQELYYIINKHIIEKIPERCKQVLKKDKIKGSGFIEQ